jgi:hypothetical protein
MRKQVDKVAYYKGQRVYIMWEEGQDYFVTASVGKRLPKDFFRDMTRPDMFVFEGKIAKDDPDLIIEE